MNINSIKMPVPGTIDLWRVQLTQSEERLREFRQWLSPDECTKVDRFHFAKDRTSSLIARGLLRLLIAHYLKLTPASLSFDYGPQGKPLLSPQIANPDNLVFNISHSGNMAILGFAVDRVLGVDIEWMREIDVDSIVERFFSVRELMEFRALPKHQRHQAFYCGWTRKEAYIKALGGGLSIPLDRFDVALSPHKEARLLAVNGDEKAAQEWSIQALKDLPENYQGAICIKDANATINYREWHEIGYGDLLTRPE